MRVARTIAEMREALNGPIGFVPTMGALHEGHLSLVRKSKRECQTTVASIFVNPLQFGPAEDLSRYPRQEAHDLTLLQEVGTDVVFAPSAEELLAFPAATVTIKEGTQRWEGPLRPGHFDGVATIVAKLFNIVSPDVAYFGLKDYQQCIVIGHLVKSLNFPIDLRFEPTIREQDGLAMSSRNAYLSPEHRQTAALIYAQLRTAAQAIASGATVQFAIDSALAQLTDAGFDVQYFDLVDAQSLEPQRTYQAGQRILVAAKLGNTRLIDNIDVN